MIAHTLGILKLNHTGALSRPLLPLPSDRPHGSYLAVDFRLVALSGLIIPREGIMGNKSGNYG